MGVTKLFTIFEPRSFTATIPAVTALLVAVLFSGTGCRRTSSAPAQQSNPAQSSSTGKPSGAVASAAPPAQPAVQPIVPSCGPVAAHQAASAYRHQLDDLMVQPGHHSLEPIFHAGTQAANLIQSPCDGVDSLLQSDSKAEIKQVLALMHGFDTAGEGAQALLPDIDFFVRLANEHGMPEDQQFFTLLRDTQTPSGFPAYVEQVTDNTSCTDFGSGRLTVLYGRWRAFGQKSQTYQEDSKHWQEEMEQEFTTGDCACGERPTVVKEMELLLNQQPSSPIAPTVRKRLDDVRSGRASFRYSCTPG